MSGQTRHCRLGHRGLQPHPRAQLPGSPAFLGGGGGGGSPFALCFVPGWTSSRMDKDIHPRVFIRTFAVIKYNRSQLQFGSLVHAYNSSQQIKSIIRTSSPAAWGSVSKGAGPCGLQTPLWGVTSHVF